MITDIERIAKIFKLDPKDELLVLKIGDIVKAKDKEIKKKKFSNDILYSKVKQRETQIHNLKSEYVESIGITEHMIIKQSRDVLRKELNKSLKETYRLRKIIEGYQEREFKDRLKKIEGVR
jgi:preprotein translocase subunit SecD